MRRKSLFFRYFVSYLGIGLLLVSIFGIVFYYYNVVQLDAEVKASHISAANQSMNKVDFLLESMSNTAYHFSSAELDGGYTVFRDDSLEPILKENLIAQRLLNYEENQTIPMDTMLYLRGDTGVYLRDGFVEYRIFEERVAKNSDLTMSRLFSTINSATKREMVKVISNLTTLESDNPSAAFVFPIPYMSIIPEASLTFFINDSEFQHIFENFSGEMERNIYLLDNALQTVYVSEVNPLDEASQWELFRMKGTGAFELTIENRSVVAVRAVSDNTGYSLVVLMEDDVFFSRVSLMQNIIGICLILFLLLSLLWALIMSVRTYQPIRSLADQFLEDSPEDDGGLEEPAPKLGELEFIRERVVTTHQKNIELGKLVDLQRPYVALTCIGNILTGKIDDERELSFQMQCANIRFTKEHFLVLLITPVERENLGQTMQQISTICENIKLDKYALYSTEFILEQRVAAIVNCDDTRPGDKPVGLYLGEMIQDLLNATYGKKVSIGVGSLYTALRDVHKSFLEAAVVTNEYLVSTPGKIMSFEDIPEQDPVDYSVSFTEQSLLLQALKQGDKTVAIQSLDKMIDHIKNGAGSFLLAQYQCVDIVNTLIKAAGQINREINRSELKSLSNFKDLEDFRQNTHIMALSLCEQYDQFKSETRSRLSADVILYVNEHFRDNSLSLESTATHFDLSTSYLSRFFKQATSRTFIQYITSLRMAYVKEQLTGTDRQIKDIVNDAGYIDVASFVRKFKSTEGVTPGQYRQRMSL